MNETQEEQYAQDLRQAQAKNKAKPQKIAKDNNTETLEALVANKNKLGIFIIAFLVAGSSDLIDLLGVGAIPIVGDILDLGTGAIIVGLFFTLAGSPRKKAQLLAGSGTLFEFLPFIINDLAPTHTLMVLITMIITYKDAAKAEKELEGR